MHLAVGGTALFATMAAVALGAGGWRGGDSRAFWVAARTGQGLIAVQVLLGLFLRMIGSRPHVAAHPVYDLARSSR